MATLQTVGQQVPGGQSPVGQLPKPITPQQPQALGVNSASPLGAGVSTYSTNPASDLRGQTIGVAPTANRMNIANTYEQNWNAQTNPQYQADLRSATSQAAGAGQLGSGQLRTSLGNLAYNRDVQRQGQESNFLNTALNGTIQDAYNNVQQADQQQAFQAGLQNQTFNQGLQSLLSGQSGNPAETQLALSQMYGQQAGAAGQGLDSLIGGTVQNNTTNALLQSLLRQYGQPGSTTPAPVGTPLYSTPTQYQGVTG